MCSRFKDKKVGGLEPQVVQDTINRAKKLLEESDRLLGITHAELRPKRTGEQWLFGLSHATALDAHLIPFIARMLDTHRGYLVPESLLKYAEHAIAQKEWKDIIRGKSTMYAV